MMSLLEISDAYNRYSVIVHDKLGLMGKEYRFLPFCGELIKDGYDEADIHYFSKNPKAPIPRGTKITVDCWWMNFFGSYFRVKYNGATYDLKTNIVKLSRP